MKFTWNQVQRSVERIIENLGCFALLATALSYFGRHAWWTDGFTHFRAQYVGILVLALVLWQRRYKLPWIVLGMIGLVWNASYVLMLYRGDIQKGTTQNYFTVLLFNVRSKNTSYEQVLNYFKKSKADVFVVEEITEKWAERLEPWSKTFVSHLELPQEDNFGLGIYSRYPLEHPKINPLSENTTPSLEGHFWFNGTQVHLLAVHAVAPLSHATWKVRNNQLDSIGAWCLDKNYNAVIAGDLNVTPWSSFFDRLLSKGRLVHMRRGFGIVPTWPCRMPLLEIPIDSVLVQNNLEIVQVERGPALGSDHFPVLVTIQTRD